MTRSVVTLLLLALATGSSIIAGQRPPAAFEASATHDQPVALLCSQMSGSTMSAPSWTFGADGTQAQQVLLHYRGDRETADVTWSTSGAPYYEASGIGLSMRAGFSVTVFTDEYVETYVYHAATSELLYSSVRSGSVLLPNTIKSFRGTCKAAAVGLQ